MKSEILNPEIQQFINANLHSDVAKLALKKNPFPEVDFATILNQISAKSKAKHKLPTWFETENIIYPSKISVEQTSSEKTAMYKSGLISGENLIDLTGGFGVDDYYFSKKMKSVVHCEMNYELSDLANHNFQHLKATNIKCFAGDSLEILKNLNQQFDWIYIDPSRRSEAKGKVFMLRECLPNVPDLLENYFKFSENILVKTAPILDISAGLIELSNVKTIHIIALENEVKELLWEIKRGYSGEVEIKTANILKDKTEGLDFDLSEEYIANLGLPKKYLYEPNSTIMKSGAFDAVGAIFNMDKLHVNSHLYTSDEIIDFPGRSFKIEQVFPYAKAEMKTFLQNKKANITVRNFPETVESIRKKWKIADGGDSYCFFTTDLNSNKIIVLCTKIKFDE